MPRRVLKAAGGELSTKMGPSEGSKGLPSYQTVLLSLSSSRPVQISPAKNRNKPNIYFVSRRNWPNVGLQWFLNRADDGPLTSIYGFENKNESEGGRSEGYHHLLELKLNN